MSETTSLSTGLAKFHGNDKLPCRIIFGIVSFWVFAQTRQLFFKTKINISTTN
jgi:hypothetical protein